MKKRSSVQASKKITEKQVSSYLYDHPAFFTQHPELLESLQFKRRSDGKIVSLADRQVEVLRERNQDLQFRLSEIMESARHNEQLFEKTRQLVLDIIAAGSIEELNSLIQARLRHVFAVDTSTLYLFSSEADDDGEIITVSYQEAEEAIPDILKSLAPTCGVLHSAEQEFLFPGNNAVGSAAVAPLSDGSQTIGVLAVGSEDAQYYRTGMGTLFLSTISECLGLVISRMLS